MNYFFRSCGLYLDAEKNREKVTVIKILAGFWFSVFLNCKK